MKEFVFDLQRFKHISSSDISAVLSGTSSDDEIYNSGMLAKIFASSGNDKINNTGNSVNIFGDDGNDYIYNYGKWAKIYGGSGRNVIYNYGQYSEVWGGDDNDRITNQNNDNSKIYAEGGDDTISTNARVTIYAGAGKDVIYIDSDNSHVDGGEDEDHVYIQGYGSANTITGGEGNNSIIGNGNAQVYIVGFGDDTIDNYGENSTIKVASADYSTQISGSDVIIKNDFASAIVKGAAGKNLIIETFNGSRNGNLIENPDEDNEVLNRNDEITLEAGKGNDSLFNLGNKVLLSGGDDNDYLSNSGENVTLHGDGGDDTIFNRGANSTIKSYEGNDYINNRGSQVTIDAGDNNDFINNSGNFVSLSGGANNDFIKNTGDFVTFNYREGDGYDVIEGFKENSTLKIDNFLASDRYSLSTVGNDVYVNISGGAAILKDAASLSNINIIGTEISPETVSSPNETYSFTEGNDNIFVYVYSDFFVSEALLYLRGGNDSIRNANYANFNSISGGTGNDTVDNSGAYVSISGDEGFDYAYNTGANVTIDGGADNDTIKNSGEKVKIFGGAGNDSISNTKANVTIDGGTDNDIILNSNSNISLYGGEGNDIISLGGYSWYYGNTAQGGAGNDTIFNDGKQQVYKYFAGDGDDVIVGINDKDTICIVDGKYTSTTSGNDVIIKVGAGSLTLKNGIEKTFSIDGVPDVAEPVEIDLTPYWKLDGSTATYGILKETLITVTGVKSVEGLSLNGEVVTVSKVALGTDNVTVSNGYTLALGKDVTKTSTKNVWSLKNFTATYTQSTTKGYKLASDSKSISYTAAANKTLATVKGVKSKDGLSLNGKVITVSKAALGTSKVTVSNGYTLAFGKDVTKTSTKNAWNLKNSTATYTQSTTKGYKLASDSKSISYTAAANKTLATVKGVKSKNGLSLNGKVITVKNTVLKNKVSVNGSGYQFNFAAGDYKKTSITATKNADIITSRGKNISINTGAGNDSINIIGSATTVNASTGNDKIISSGSGNLFVYASGDGNDVIANFSAKDKIKITKGTAKITTNASDVFITVGKGKIKLSGAAGKNISITDANGKTKIHKTTAPSGEYWFTTSDNDFGTTPQLSSIVKNSSEVSLLNLTSLTNLTKKNTLLTTTYSGKK